MKQSFSTGQRGQKDLWEVREARPKGRDGGSIPHSTARYGVLETPNTHDCELCCPVLCGAIGRERYALTLNCHLVALSSSADNWQHLFAV